MRRGERSSICGCFAGKVSLLHAGAKASLVFWPREMPGHAAHSSQRSSQSMRDSRQSWGWRRGDHQKARDMRPVVSGARYNSRSGEPSSFILFWLSSSRVESHSPGNCVYLVWYQGNGCWGFDMAPPFACGVYLRAGQSIKHLV